MCLFWQENNFEEEKKVQLEISLRLKYFII